MRLGIHTGRGLSTHRPGWRNAELAEALFRLSETEAPGERRLEILRLAYTVFDAEKAVTRSGMRQTPAWLSPLVSQLMSCEGAAALDAAVERLSGGRSPRRLPLRERFFSRQEVDDILELAPPALRPERMRGAFHWHTTDSDGKAPLEAMARACRQRGSAWGVVTDHSRALEIASGLDLEGVRLQRRRIRRLNQRMRDDLHLFQGLEVEILEDGGLDLTASERQELDCVVVAVHRAFDPEKDQTERLLRAISTPGVDVLAHPRGRHFHQRPGLKAKWGRVFAACAAEGVAVEINGFPRRQDLDFSLAAMAAEAGCHFFLASDAHAPHHLEFDAFACAIAAKAGLPSSSILNTRHAEDVESRLNGGSAA